MEFYPPKPIGKSITFLMCGAYPQKIQWFCCRDVGWYLYPLVIKSGNGKYRFAQPETTISCGNVPIKTYQNPPFWENCPLSMTSNISPLSPLGQVAVSWDTLAAGSVKKLAPGDGIQGDSNCFFLLSELGQRFHIMNSHRVVDLTEIPDICSLNPELLAVTYHFMSFHSQLSPFVKLKPLINSIPRSY